MRTKCSEIIAIALKKLQKNEQVNSFSLYKMKNMNKQGMLLSSSNFLPLTFGIVAFKIIPLHNIQNFSIE